MKIDVVDDISGDWTGIYVNNNIYYQGHSVPHYIWMELLEKSGNEINDYNEWPGEDYGQLPTTFEEVKEQFINKR